MRAQIGERLIFDHVHKTGGWAVSEALVALLPPGLMSPHFNPGERPVADAEILAWHHIAGHFGHELRHRLPHFDTACTATAVREPVACVASTYTYWRFNIPRDYGPHVARAHDLAFSDFIRSEPLDPAFLNPQASFLGGPLHGDAENFAQEALDPYDLVGLTTDLPGFLGRMLDRLAPDKTRRAAESLRSVTSNASLGRVTPTPEDLAYLAERQAYDRALYAEALRRAGAVPSQSATQVIGPDRDQVSVSSPAGGATPKTLTT